MSQFIDFPEIHVKVEGMEQIRIPRMVKIRQHFDEQKIEDIKAHVEMQMKNVTNPEQYKGKRLAITAGSRGIPHLDLIIKSIIDVLLEWGAKPFIVPAMGSHGGATAEGQREMLATYNITEETMGVPILSSMEVVQLGSLDDGTPIYCDKNAAESDGIIILNKVKPHTDFRGEHESGMAKMMAIGLAKHKGASMFHMKGFPSFADRIPKVCEVFMQHAPMAFCVGIVQNAYDEICAIDIADSDKLLEKDAQLLRLAKDRMAKFLFKDIDVLVIDEIGKNISGNGHDPNITARSNSKGFDEILNLKKLFIRGLNEETHHNGCGMSAADITTRRALRSIDYETMWINVVTSTMLNGGKTPMYTETDKEALMIAIRTCTGVDFSFDNVKVVRIKDTLHMGEFEVSENYIPLLKDNPNIEIIGEPYDMQFDAEGFMI